MNSWLDIITPVSFFICSALFSSAVIFILLRSPVVNFFKDKPDSRKVHAQPIPRLGGVVIISVYLLMMPAIYILNRHFNGIESVSLGTITIFIISSLTILIFGFFDDTTFFTVRVRHKIIAEVAIALCAVFVFDVNIGRLSIFGIYTLPLWASNSISFFWILGLSNAFNLVDGLDGLAGMLSLIAVATVATLAILGGQSSIVIICCVLCGALVGFLIHNMPQAKTFMGDTGSLFLGNFIALVTLYIGREVIPERAFVVMPLIAGIPIMDVLVTMVRRYFKAIDRNENHAERIHYMVIPDNSHLHHRYIYRGCTPFQSTILISSLAVILCIGAVCIALAPLLFIPAILFYISIPVVLKLDQLGFGGRFKKALHLSETRYNGFKKASLIGVIDHEGSFSELLSDKKKNQSVNYINITEDQIPGMSSYLHTAVVHEKSESESIVQRAEKISSVLSRPVFVVEKSSRSGFFVREISKNGTLIIHEKNSSVKELIKDLERVSYSGKVKHVTLTKNLDSAPLWENEFDQS